MPDQPVASSPTLPSAVEDQLKREVSLSAQWDKSGLTVAGKSRALSAADQMLGGILGWPGSLIEGVRRRSEVRSAIKTAHLEAELTAALRQIEEMPELGRRAASRMLRDEIGKQENREAIWEEAEQQLSLPAPSDGSSEELDTAEVLDPDWVKRFTGFAENIGNEDIQKVWGRVLAGEIRKPGSFSYSALRVLAELEPDLAKGFSDLWLSSVTDYAPMRSGEADRSLILLSDLELAGLIQQGLFIEVTAREDGFAYILGDLFGARIHMPDGYTKLQMPVTRFTRMGMQIGSILPRNEDEAIKVVAGILGPIPPVRVELLTLARTEAGRANITSTADVPTGNAEDKA